MNSTHDNAAWDLLRDIEKFDGDPMAQQALIVHGLSQASGFLQDFSTIPDFRDSLRGDHLTIAKATAQQVKFACAAGSPLADLMQTIVSSIEAAVQAVETDGRPQTGEELACGRELSMDEFREIVAEIHAHHRFGRFDSLGGRHVKYIRPHIDTRDWMVYRIGFGGFDLKDKIFDFRDSPEPMYDRIRAWLGATADTPLNPRKTFETLDAAIHELLAVAHEGASEERWNTVRDAATATLESHRKALGLKGGTP